MASRTAANDTGATSRTPSLMKSHTVLQIKHVTIQTATTPNYQLLTPDA
jgi:hypothetical protein